MKIRFLLPVPVLVDDVGDLDNLTDLELELVLQLSCEALLDLGELLHGAAHPGLLGASYAVHVGVRLPAQRDREHAWRQKKS